MPPALRRALSVTFVWVLALGLLAGVPALLPLAFGLDLLRRRRWATLRFLSFVGALAWAEALGSAAALAIGRDPARNLALQRRWAGFLGRAAFLLWDIRLEAETAGAALDRGPYVLALRHVTLADTLLPMLLGAIPFGLAPRYILKDELRWDPCLDIVGSRLPNVFVKRDLGESARGDDAVSAAQEAQRAEIVALAAGMREGGFAAIYPEGTRYTPARRERLLARLEGAAQQRAARFTAVLPPRIGGLSALLDGCPDADVVICAHRGMESAARLPDLWRGELIGARWVVRVTRHPRATIPASREARAAWLDERWAELDAWVRAGAGRGEEPPTGLRSPGTPAPS